MEIPWNLTSQMNHSHLCFDCFLFFSLFGAVSAMKKVDPLAAIGATGLVSMEKLSKWFYESHLDPNDPANADLIYLLGVSKLHG